VSRRERASEMILLLHCSGGVGVDIERRGRSSDPEHIEELRLIHANQT